LNKTERDYHAKTDRQPKAGNWDGSDTYAEYTTVEGSTSKCSAEWRARTRRENLTENGWTISPNEWSQITLQELSQAAMDRKSWKSLVKRTSDIYGR